MYQNRCHHLILFDSYSGSDPDMIKIRPMSYPYTDVFLICFSLVNQTSFENVKSVWLPELRNKEMNYFGTPILLVGTKLDLRNDQEFLKKMKENGVKPISNEMGNSLKNKIGALGYIECNSRNRKDLWKVLDSTIEIAIQSTSQDFNKKKQCILS
jgi:GTPase SAR1 family protein